MINHILLLLHFPPPFYPVHRSLQCLSPYVHILPAVKVSAVCTAIVDPAVLMALTLIVYLLSSLRSLRVCDLMEPSEMVTVNGPPVSEHPLMVYLYVISKLAMTPDTVQVMVRVVAVGAVTWRLFTGPGTITGGSVGVAVVGAAVMGAVVAVGGADDKTNKTKVNGTLWYTVP